MDTRLQKVSIWVRLNAQKIRYMYFNLASHLHALGWYVSNINAMERFKMYLVEKYKR